MLSVLLLASIGAVGPAGDLPIGVLARHGGPAPAIWLWTNKDDVFRRGERIRVYFETDQDAYITVFRIDTDGRVRVLFPLDPWDDNYARGGVRYQVEARGGGYSFRVDDYPGQGYVFAVASADPFRYAHYVRGDYWDYAAIAENGRIAGDPYVALGELIDHIVPANYVGYTYDVLPYYVERNYTYPRFLCYECHAYAPWPYWDPYAHSCIRFRVVVYDDPYYYPARAVPGTRVIYRRPTVIVPRYVFRDRHPDDDYLVQVRERPVDNEGRRRIEPGATRRVLDGGTRLPTPTVTDGRRPTVQSPAGRRVAPVPERRATDAPTPRLERRDPRRTDQPVRPARRGRNDPQRVEPPQTESRRPQSPSAETRRNEPRRVEPPRAEPRQPESRRAEPQRTEARPKAPSPPRRADPPKRRRN